MKLQNPELNKHYFLMNNADIREGLSKKQILLIMVPQ